ncbi:MAG TPA: aspartate carbamoyltransferase regulatory subunit [Candidatus Nanoarchaeia archaeon]|nr:aspartate carbamoyltransferase regulatory subunit [Candidatus Nanoarchaeia archaeon]
MVFDIISMRDFTREQILAVLDVADDVKKAIHDPRFNRCEFSQKYGFTVDTLLSGLKVATLFLESSTRTYYSFRAAVNHAGGICDGFPSPAYTSLRKGETWEDTVAMFSGYGYDTIVMRSTVEGLPRWTKESLERNHRLLSEQHQRFKEPFAFPVPLVINGGDGTNQHPTQCFLDLYTMREAARSKGRKLDGLEVALLNDLRYGRTNASIMSVAHLFNLKLFLAHPNRFGPPSHRLEDLVRKGVEVHDFEEDFMAAMASAVVAYQSRPQKERVGKGEDLIYIKQLGQITKAMYDRLGEKAPFLMHPLPVDAENFGEIARDLRYHHLNLTKLQSSNALPVRIALLALGLGRINVGVNFSNDTSQHDQLQLQDLPLSTQDKVLENPSSGFIKGDGVVLDHIPMGMARRLYGILGFEGQVIPKTVADYVPPDNPRKDILKLLRPYQFFAQQYEAMALIAPDITVSFIESGRVVRKVRPVLGSYTEGLVKCGNLPEDPDKPDERCVTNVEKEGVARRHLIELVNGSTILRCPYCERTDTVANVYRENRFVYLNPA